jgi:hypothetical protein
LVVAVFIIAAVVLRNLFERRTNKSHSECNIRQ